MNGYDLTRNWYNYKFKNIDKVKASHSDMYFYIIDLWNRLGQVSKIGLPTTVTMQALGIGSYNTYKKTLEQLVDFGFVKIISKSANQHQSKVVALSKIDKSTDESLDKAHTKAPDESPDSIIEQITNNKEQYNNADFDFDSFWSLYPNKVGKKKTEMLFAKLSSTDKQKIQSTISAFVLYKPFKDYNLPHPSTYINGRRFEDEIPIFKQTKISIQDERFTEATNAIRDFDNRA